MLVGFQCLPTVVNRGQLEKCTRCRDHRDCVAIVRHDLITHRNVPLIFVSRDLALSNEATARYPMRAATTSYRIDCIGRYHANT